MRVEQAAPAILDFHSRHSPSATCKRAIEGAVWQGESKTARFGQKQTCWCDLCAPAGPAERDSSWYEVLMKQSKYSAGRGAVGCFRLVAFAAHNDSTKQERRGAAEVRATAAAEAWRRTRWRGATCPLCSGDAVARRPMALRDTRQSQGVLQMTERRPLILSACLPSRRRERRGSTRRGAAAHAHSRRATCIAGPLSPFSHTPATAKGSVVSIPLVFLLLRACFAGAIWLERERPLLAPRAHHHRSPPLLPPNNTAPGVSKDRDDWQTF